MASEGRETVTNRVMPKPGARFLVALLIVLAMVFSMSFASNAVTIKTVYVSLDDKVLNHAALESEGILFLPLRSVCEALGYSVEWSRDDWSVTIKNENKTVLLEPKKDTVTDQRHSYFISDDYPNLGYIGGGCIAVSGLTYIDAGIIESCFGIAKTYDQASNTYKLSVLSQEGMTTDNIKTTMEDSRLLSTIQYPRITTPDKAAADKINTVILADVEAAGREMEDMLKETEGYQSPNKFETYFNYRSPYRQGDLLSLVLTDYQYFGGAHGSNRQISHTFDLKTGEEYALADLMKDGSGYVEYINDSIKTAIVERELAEAQIAEFVSIADDQSYYLTNKGLVVYFQQYEYFPGAAGIQEFVFPWADLAQYLKPEFQLN